MKLFNWGMVFGSMSCAGAWSAEHQWLGMEVWWWAACILTGFISACLVVGSAIMLVKDVQERE